MLKDNQPDPAQMNFLHADLLDQLNPKHPLLRLANHIPWGHFETEFTPLYSDQGKPAKPIRLMVGLSILKHLEDLSDEVLVERWVQNPYYQVFCGASDFQWQLPCDSSDLTYFRKRIGSEGFEKILSVSVALHGEAAIEAEMTADTTVQEKNTTFPTDAKQYRKIHGQLLKLARAESIQLSRTHEKEVKQLKQHTRFASHPRNRKKARRAVKRLKTIAGRLLRAIQRQMDEEQQHKHHEILKLYQRVLDQKRGDKNKIYSLHEPHIYCMSKGKDHKRYEFGTKASIAKTRDSNIIIGALAFDKNIYDGHTLPDVLSQVERILDHVPKICLGDRGYRGKSKINDTQILIPKPPRKNASKTMKDEMRKRFQRRAAIEPVIGHLKSDHRLNRNFLKGFTGDQINLLMAAAAFNFKKWMREVLLWLKNITQGFVWTMNSDYHLNKCS
jgi:IS5 family transposase